MLDETNYIHPADRQYIEALKSGERALTDRFFSVELGPLLGEIRAEVFGRRVQPEELVSELYLLLSADGWRRLDSFTGRSGCRLRTWTSQVAWRYFLSARARILGCRECETDTGADAASGSLPEAVDDDLRIQIAIDVNATLCRMPNRRYAEILRLLLIEGYAPADVASMLGTTADNVYNLKHRAVMQFIRLYGSR